MGTIYLLTVDCGDRQRMLVGQTRNKLARRLACYKCDLYYNRYGNPYLQNCFNKYGWSAFKFTELEQCDNQQLNERERHYIITLNTYQSDHGMNLTTGGESGKYLSQESRDKMSKAHEGRVVTAEWRKNMSIARQGRKPALGLIHTDETKRAIAKAHGSTEFTIRHVDGRTITDVNKNKVAKQVGMSTRQLRRILNGEAKQSSGWSLSKPLCLQ